MFIYLLLVLMMVTAVSSVNKTDCMSGWFGENCMYKCHCAHSNSCAINGDCPQDEGCETGFFGPACQYVDLVIKEGSTKNEPYVSDGNDSTCNLSKNQTSVEVHLKKELPFSWFRIYFNRLVTVPEINNTKVTLNNGDQCYNKKTYFVSSNLLDVSCDTNILVKKLTIEGPISEVVCTIRISGGRNVALKQEASQSSNITNDISKGLPSRAVDGNTNNDYETSYSCSTTGVEESGPEWHLQFNRPQILFRIVIYNRGGVLMRRLRGFSLTTFAEDGTETNYFNDTSENASLVYEINLFSRVPVTSLMIKGGVQLYVPDRILTLCEVEAYGETFCPDETFGIYCNHACKCTSGQFCSEVTGICTQGCPTGAYGFNCSRQCSKACLDLYCTQVYGTCLQCAPGYKGDTCALKCDPGSFGHLCESNCSIYCVDNCDFINGNCKTCKGDHVGTRCSECIQGTYGNNCDLFCPSTCKDALCDVENGNCFSCAGSHTGPTCEDCPPGFYGNKCSSPCSKYCFNGSCNMSGKCSSCTDGYSGDNCVIAPDKNYTSHIPILIAMLVFILGLFLLFYLRKPKLSSDEDAK